MRAPSSAGSSSKEATSRSRGSTFFVEYQRWRRIHDPTSSVSSVMSAPYARRTPFAQDYQGNTQDQRVPRVTPRAAMNGSGSICTPFTRTSKCRWHPVDSPVLPT